MIQNDCSRRAFLKKFALLSAGTFVLGATTMACYGPIGPRPSGTVSGMYFRDVSLNLWPLKNNQNVPVDATFEVLFFDPMNTAAAATVEFTDQNDVPVPFGQAWDSDYSLSVAPSSNLLLSTEYRLVVLDIESKTGEKINLAGEADATFKTVAV
jgi:hypothetical protein